MAFSCDASLSFSHCDTFSDSPCFGDFVHTYRAGNMPDILRAKCLHLLLKISVLERVSSSIYSFIQPFHNRDYGQLF